MSSLQRPVCWLRGRRLLKFGPFTSLDRSRGKFAASLQPSGRQSGGLQCYDRPGDTKRMGGLALRFGGRYRILERAASADANCVAAASATIGPFC